MKISFLPHTEIKPPRFVCGDVEQDVDMEHALIWATCLIDYAYKCNKDSKKHNPMGSQMRYHGNPHVFS